MYRQALARGYRGSLAQLALGCAQTGGYTPEGRAAWARNEARNQANEAAGARRYQSAVEDTRSTVVERNAQAAQNLQNRQRHYDSAAGMPTERSYAAPDDNGHDPHAGRHYQQDSRGNYVSCDPDGCVRI